jgi:Leucine-rich repeat (LRR) protein
VVGVFCLQLQTLKRNSLLEDLNDNFTHIGMHDLWIEFAVAETRSQDSRDHHRWMYQVNEKKALGRRTGRWRESVERMCFLNDGWKALKKLNLYDFPNVEVFKLGVATKWMQDSTLDLDLTGLKQLKSLELNVSLSKITGLCSLTNLVFLQCETYPLSPCLKDIRRLTNLQALFLLNCTATRVLDLTNLEALRRVEIFHFPNLTAVRGFSSRMGRLQSLAISQCRELVECAGLGEVWSLEVLSVRDSDRLEELPCLGRLTRLQQLDLSQSKSLRAVPGLSDLVALEMFWADGCVELAAVPDLVKLTRLLRLDIKNCPVQEVPGLDGLVALTILRASFGMLAKDIQRLTNLQTLTLCGCTATRVLDLTNLEALRRVIIFHFPNLTAVRGFSSRMGRLQSLGIWGCRELVECAGLGEVWSLEELHVRDSDRLEELPCLGRLTRLRKLSISQSKSLRAVPGLSDLVALEMFWAEGCVELAAVPDLVKLTRLQRLDIKDCPVQEVAGLDSLVALTILRASFGMVAKDIRRLTNLQTLTLCGCTATRVLDLTKLEALRNVEIFHFPNLTAVRGFSSRMGRLQSLGILGCRELVECAGLGEVCSLEELWVRDSDRLEELPCLGRLTRLRELGLSQSKSLRAVPGLSDLVALEMFWAEGCIELAAVPDLVKLTRLQRLDIKDCPVQEVPGLDGLVALTILRASFGMLAKDIRRLTNLQTLTLCGCTATRVLDLTNLEALRNVEIFHFPNLTAVRGFSSRMDRLQSLAIWGCRELVECAGLGEVCSLEELWVRDSDRLEELPCLGRLTRLRELGLSQSKSLRAVPGLSDLVALEMFWAEGCVELAAVPDLVKLTRLQRLDIKDCPVQEVPGLDGLVALTILHASFGMLAKPVRSLSKLSMLKQVKIGGWSGPIWTSIQSLLVLEHLQLADLTGDESVVPDLRSLARLKFVLLIRCNCKDATGLSNSVALEALNFFSCEKLERLPKLERLTKLTHLAIKGCVSLQDSPSSLCSSLHSLTVDVPASLMRFATSSTGLRRLALSDDGWEDALSIMASRLERLSVSWCATMEAVDVGSFPRLEVLSLDVCSGLQRVTCSRSLTHGLRELEVTGCRSLVELPDLSTFPQLESLQLEECRGIKRLSCSRPVVALEKIELIRCDPGMEFPVPSRFPKLKEFKIDDS